MRWMFLPLLMGCTAARGTIKLVEAEQDFALAQSAEASDLAVYAWTMAESYMHKSREEYAHADYEAAAELAAKASEWSVKAKSIAEGMELKPLEEVPDVISTSPQPAVAPRSEPSAPPADEDPAEGLDLDDADPTLDELESKDEDLNIDDILFDDEEEEGDW